MPDLLYHLPGSYNITIYQGDRVEFIVKLENENTPIDLTGYTAKAEIRMSSGNKLVGYFDCTILDQSTNTGEIRLILPPSRSETVPPYSLSWDLQLSTGPEHNRTVLQGKFVVKKETTNNA